ncbi:MAG TPA: ROK family protein [Anaerolineales bacterium]|jgi:predicted NBD/HSP70 family sugar kinase|nr:ROK family protein [Anaerolineales bacterium]
MTIVIGLDIGGTKIMVAAADHEGTILQRARTATSSSLEEDLTNINTMISEVAGGDQIIGMGAAIGGPLDWEQGIVSPLHQPAWRNIPLKALMEEKWGCPLHVDVDTNVAAVGEYRWGNVSAKRFLYLTLSTGMGGGFLIDGRIYRGQEGAHPEVGHQSIHFRSVNPSAVHCECGAPDCLEALVSGNGIRRIYRKPAENLSAEEWEEVAYNLGQGLRNMAALYAPDLIRIGGGVAVGGGENFIIAAKSVMEEHLKLVPAPQVELSHLGYDTALRGAIAMALPARER